MGRFGVLEAHREQGHVLAGVQRGVLGQTVEGGDRGLWGQVSHVSMETVVHRDLFSCHTNIREEKRINGVFNPFFT